TDRMAESAREPTPGGSDCVGTRHDASRIAIFRTSARTVGGAEPEFSRKVPGSAFTSPGNARPVAFQHHDGAEVNHCASCHRPATWLPCFASTRSGWRSVGADS